VDGSLGAAGSWLPAGPLWHGMSSATAPGSPASARAVA